MKYQGANMEELKQKIIDEGKALNNDILKVDSFINNQVDPLLMMHIGEDIAEHYRDKGITKVAAIETSGIAPAIMTASALQVPMVIIKKHTNKLVSGGLLQTEITSFTTGDTFELTVSPKFLKKDDHVLIIDDILANGEAIVGVIRLIRLAHATVAGSAVLIEKAFQPGRKKLEEAGVEVYSLTKIISMKKGHIEVE